MINIEFHPGTTTLAEICKGLEAGRTAGTADASVYDAATRREALAQYLRTKVQLPLPDVELYWRTGSRTIPAARAGGEPAGATARGTAYVHFGAVHIATGNAVQTQPSIIACSFATARTRYAAQFSRALQAAGALPKTPSARLFTAFQNCGVFIYVPPGARNNEPLTLLWNYPQGSAEAVFPYILVYVDTDAQAEIIERHIGPGDTFLCGAVQVVAAARARCTYVVLQNTGETAIVQHTRTVRAAAGATVCYVQAELGANFSRLRLHNDLTGAKAEITHAILSLRADLQRGDMHIATRHRAEGTRSRQIRRFVLGGRSRVRSTEIISGHDTRGMRNESASEALLFSHRASIAFEPLRSIARAHVSARERIAVGTLDEETIFYLRTRGIPLREARRMAALAFFEPAIEFAPSDELRNEIRLALDDEIDRVTGFAEE